MPFILGPARKLPRKILTEINAQPIQNAMTIGSPQCEARPFLEIGRNELSSRETEKPAPPLHFGLADTVHQQARAVSSGRPSHPRRRLPAASREGAQQSSVGRHDSEPVQNRWRLGGPFAARGRKPSRRPPDLAAVIGARSPNWPPAVAKRTGLAAGQGFTKVLALATGHDWTCMNSARRPWTWRLGPA